MTDKQPTDNQQKTITLPVGTDVDPLSIIGSSTDLRFFDDKGNFVQIVLEDLNEDQLDTNKRTRKEIMTEAFNHVWVNFGYFPVVVTNYESICVVDKEWFAKNNWKVSHEYYKMPYTLIRVGCAASPLSYTVEHYNQEDKAARRTPKVDDAHPARVDNKGGTGNRLKCYDIYSYVDCHDRIHAEQTALGRRPALVCSALEGMWFGYIDQYWQDPCPMYYARDVRQWNHIKLGATPISLSVHGVTDAVKASDATARGIMNGEAENQSRMGYRTDQMMFVAFIVRILFINDDAARSFNDAHPYK